MIQLNNKLDFGIDNNIKNQFSGPSYWQSGNYSSLLNREVLNKSVRQNVWSYELKSMLKSFLKDLSELKQDLKFKISGKILNSSTYVLKTKTNLIINTSLETQEEINEVQSIEEVDNGNVDDFTCYDDETELFETFAELEAQNLLSESEKALLKEEKIKHILNLEVSELYNKLKNKINQLSTPPKLVYKKVEMCDLAEALNDAINAKNLPASNEKQKKKKLIEKSQLSFLPNNFIENAEKKRANFENRISDFHENLKNLYKGEPIPFLKMINDKTAKGLVEALLSVLHLINQKKIELWKKCNEISEDLNDSIPLIKSENNGQNLFLSPL